MLAAKWEIFWISSGLKASQPNCHRRSVLKITFCPSCTCCHTFCPLERTWMAGQHKIRSGWWLRKWDGSLLHARQGNMGTLGLSLDRLNQPCYERKNKPDGKKKSLLVFVTSNGWCIAASEHVCSPASVVDPLSVWNSSATPQVAHREVLLYTFSFPSTFPWLYNYKKTTIPSAKVVPWI